MTLTVGNIEKCLEDSVPKHMLETLSLELGIPPQHTRGNPYCLIGVKVWLLVDPTASWQKFAIALYASTLDGALKKLKELKFLPLQGLLFVRMKSWFLIFACIYIYCTHAYEIARLGVLITHSFGTTNVNLFTGKA